MSGLHYGDGGVASPIGRSTKPEDRRARRELRPPSGAALRSAGYPIVNLLRLRVPVPERHGVPRSRLSVHVTARASTASQPAASASSPQAWNPDENAPSMTIRPAP